MAFYKKKKQKVNGLWYPMAVTVGKPVNTDEVADRLAQISTVSRADTYAVLKDLAGVLADLYGARPYSEDGRPGHVLLHRQYDQERGSGREGRERRADRRRTRALHPRGSQERQRTQHGPLADQRQHLLGGACRPTQRPPIPDRAVAAIPRART